MFQLGCFCGAEIKSLQVLCYPSLPLGACTWYLLFVYGPFGFSPVIFRYLKAQGPVQFGCDGPSQPLPGPERCDCFFPGHRALCFGYLWCIQTRCPCPFRLQGTTAVFIGDGHLGPLPGQWGFLWMGNRDASDGFFCAGIVLWSIPVCPLAKDGELCCLFPPMCSS